MWKRSSSRPTGFGCPLGHPLAQQETITLEELAGQPLIQLMVEEIEESTRRLTAALPVKPQIAFRTRSVEAVRSLVATGAGLAILPSLVYRPWSLEGDRIEIPRCLGRFAVGAGRPGLAQGRAAVVPGLQLRPHGTDRYRGALTHRKSDTKHPRFAFAIPADRSSLFT